jgi:hypothetical protein
MTQKELVLLRSRLIKEVIKDRRKKEKTKWPSYYLLLVGVQQPKHLGVCKRGVIFHPLSLSYYLVLYKGKSHTLYGKPYSDVFSTIGWHITLHNFGCPLGDVSNNGWILAIGYSNFWNSLQFFFFVFSRDTHWVIMGKIVLSRALST